VTEFAGFVDLAAERLGGAALLANDEFFAPKENLVKASAPVWREGEYTDRGKWMDGWETRRRREPGHDWCIVRLALPGIIRGLVVDTSHFTGNYPESCSVDACTIDEPRDAASFADPTIAWTEILSRSPLRGDTRNEFRVESNGRFTHVRLNIFPDGGVARLRVLGEVVPDRARFARARADLDLAAVENGGMAVAASDMFYGNPQNLLLPGPALGMSDGWETRRRRGPGHDWVIIRLGAPGTLHLCIVDTSHFKGNAPGSCSLDACHAPGERVPSEVRWMTLVPETALRPHTVHELRDTVRAVGTVTHVRLNIFPDGGVARLRLHGVIARD
jgi:allantoicase